MTAYKISTFSCINPSAFLRSDKACPKQVPFNHAFSWAHMMSILCYCYKLSQPTLGKPCISWVGVNTCLFILSRNKKTKHTPPFYFLGFWMFWPMCIKIPPLRVMGLVYCSSFGKYQCYKAVSYLGFVILWKFKFMGFLHSLVFKQDLSGIMDEYLFHPSLHSFGFFHFFLGPFTCVHVNLFVHVSLQMISPS